MTRPKQIGLLLFALVAILVASPGSLACAHGHVSVGFYGGFGYWPCYAGYAYPGPYYGYPYYGYGPPPNYSLVDTDISPEEARVVLDGEDIGQADDFDGWPRYLAVSPGRHVIEFKSPGHTTLLVHLRARPGALYELDQKLAIAVAAEKGASPAEPDVQQMDLGGPPVGPQGEPPVPRKHDSHLQGNEPPIEPDEGGAQMEGGSGAADEDFGSVQFEPGQGGSEGSAQLVLRVHPDDAAVYLDGRFIGAGRTLGESEGLKVAAGRHVLEVVKPGFDPLRTTIAVSEGEKRALSLELQLAGAPDDPER